MSKEQFEVMRNAMSEPTPHIYQDKDNNQTQANLTLSTPLAIEHIEFRIQSINNGGYATILAYKSSRVDMDYLDACVGANNWKRSHQLIGDRLYCTVSIYDSNKQQWISKQDVGTESATEKEKGQASDSFKRACFNWGIGRCLYSFPIIQIKLNDDEIIKDNTSGKIRQSYGLKLNDWKWYIEYDKNGKCSYLGCKDTNGKIRFQYGQLKK